MTKNQSILLVFISSFGSALVAIYTFINGHADWEFLKTPEAIAHFCWIIGSTLTSIYTALTYRIPIKLESVSEQKLNEIKKDYESI